MTPGNLFNIILKIFGLFFLRDIVYIIPQLISSIPYFTKANHYAGEQYSGAWILPFIITLIAIAFYGFIIYQLLFNTNKIIDKLKLNIGFDQQDFSFNLSTSLILNISLIVIGGIILTNEIPDFCRTAFLYFQEKKLTHGMAKPDFSPLITSGVKILLGLLIIGERNRIITFAENRQAKKKDKETE